MDDLARYICCVCCTKEEVEFGYCDKHAAEKDPSMPPVPLAEWFGRRFHHRFTIFE